MKDGMQEALKGLLDFDLTQFGLKNCRRGKVRSIGEFGDGYLLMVTNYRWSAFNYNSTQPMPYRAEALNAQNEYIFKLTSDILKNWTIENPFPTVTVGKKLRILPFEFIYRRVFMGSLYADYKKGSRGEQYGFKLGENLDEFHVFISPIFTPTRKSENDEPISKEQMLLEAGIDNEIVENAILKGGELFDYIYNYMQKRDLLLADAKFEFGIDSDGNLVLADEAPNADSARYFNLTDFSYDKYEGKRPKQLSKEYFRELLKSKYHWTGETPQMPELTDEELEHGGNLYKELTEKMTGKEMPSVDYKTAAEKLRDTISDCVRKYRLQCIF